MSRRHRRHRARGAHRAPPLVITLASSQFLYSRVSCSSRWSALSLTVSDRLGRPVVARPVRVRRPRRVHDRGAAHRRHPVRVRDPRRRRRGRGRRGRDRSPRAPGEGPLPGGHDARVRDRHPAVAAVASLFLGGTTVAILPPAAPRSVDLRDQRTVLLPVPRGAGGRDRGRDETAQQRDRTLGDRHRDNERSAAAFTIAPARRSSPRSRSRGRSADSRAGSSPGSSCQFGVTSFPVETSISVVTIAVIGGLGSVIGPVLRARGSSVCRPPSATIPTSRCSPAASVCSSCSCTSLAV